MGPFAIYTYNGFSIVRMRGGPPGMNEQHEILKQVKLFAWLTDADYDFIASMITEKNYGQASSAVERELLPFHPRCAGSRRSSPNGIPQGIFSPCTWTPPLSGRRAVLLRFSGRRTLYSPISVLSKLANLPIILAFVIPDDSRC